MMSNTELSAGERRRLDDTLGADERLLMAVKPRADVEDERSTVERIISVVFLVICLGLTIGMAEAYSMACILTLPAWISGLLGFFLPNIRRKRRRLTLYAITDRRVLLWEPNRCMMSRLRSIPLRADMIQEVACMPGGYGNLVFDYARDEWNGASEERVAKQVGFIDIPQVKRVQSVLESAIAAYERKRNRN
jgi:hypothetical protein